MNEVSRAEIVGSAMWQLVDRYTGCVGYRGGTKAEGLAFTPPVIDCSGWVSLLLSTAMRAVNDASKPDVFDREDIAAISTWSDRLIQEVEIRTGYIVEGDRIATGDLSRCATIGLTQGGGAWAANHPRPRGITHVVQIVSRPGDGALFVSEAQGWAEPFGLRLLPLAQWLAMTKDYLQVGRAWAVDCFAETR